MSPQPVSIRSSANESVVRAYFDALRRGAVIDALNAFATDATLFDEDGIPRRGIREIAAFFAGRRDPMEIQIDELERSRDSIVVRVRMHDAHTGETRGYRDFFRLSGQRIRSLSVKREGVHAGSTPKTT